MTEDKNNKRTILLEEQRHKEITDALKAMTTAIGNANKHEVVAKAIENNTKEIGNLNKSLSELEVNVAAPNVNVQTNQQTVADAINGLKEQSKRIEDLLKQQNLYFEEMCRPKDYEFEFARNQWGVMQSPIKAKQKILTLKN